MGEKATTYLTSYIHNTSLYTHTTHTLHTHYTHTTHTLHTNYQTHTHTHYTHTHTPVYYLEHYYDPLPHSRHQQWPPHLNQTPTHNQGHQLMAAERLLIVINMTTLHYHRRAYCKSNAYPTVGLSLQHKVQVGWVIVIGPDTKEVVTC